MRQFKMEEVGNPLTHFRITVLEIFTEIDPSNPNAVEDAVKKFFDMQPWSENLGSCLNVFWTEFLTVVKDTTPGDPRMGLLAEVVWKIETHNAGRYKIFDKEYRLWKDLPLLREHIDQAWDFYDRKGGPPKESSWASLNSFVARIHGAIDCMDLAIEALRSSLEQVLDDKQRAVCALETTHEWITHAGAKLYYEALTLPEDSVKYEKLLPGSLAEDVGPGLTLARLKFWRERVEELMAQVRGRGDVWARAEKTVNQMKGFEMVR